MIGQMSNTADVPILSTVDAAHDEAADACGTVVPVLGMGRRASGAGFNAEEDVHAIKAIDAVDLALEGEGPVVEVLGRHEGDTGRVGGAVTRHDEGEGRVGSRGINE